MPDHAQADDPLGRLHCQTLEEDGANHGENLEMLEDIW